MSLEFDIPWLSTPSWVSFKLWMTMLLLCSFPSSGHRHTDCLACVLWDWIGPHVPSSFIYSGLNHCVDGGGIH